MDDDRAELSQFLKSRRARLRPQDAEVRGSDAHRRVAGLRREEVARLAGVSVAHYTRLEQGDAGSVSTGVLDAVGAALRLDADELAYLHRMARPSRPCVTAAADPEVTAGTRHLLHAFAPSPAWVMGRHTQLLAWNRSAALVFGDFAALPRARRSLSHVLFTDPYSRSLHGPAWEDVARDHVAQLRMLLGYHRGDPGLVGHITDLRAASPEFAGMWEARAVARLRGRRYVLRHPVAGELTLYGERLTLPEEPACVGLDVYAAEPGSPSEDALRHLAAESGT